VTVYRPHIPQLYLLCDYPGVDVGADISTVSGDDMYDPGCEFLLPGLDFGVPDKVKVLEYVEVAYDSLEEVSGLARVRPALPLTDPGRAYAVYTFSAVADASKPGVLWNTTWATTSYYAPLRRYRARAYMGGKQSTNRNEATGVSFDVHLAFEPNLLPFMVDSVTFRYRLEPGAWRESGVLKT
jgi:hypothetical protein